MLIKFGEWILSLYSNNPFWLFLSIIVFCVFLYAILKPLIKKGFNFGKVSVPGDNSSSKKEEINYISKERHLLYMKDLHDIMKKIFYKESETLKKQMIIALNIKSRVNSFEFPFIKDLIETRYEEEGVVIDSAFDTIAYWYGKDIIHQLDFDTIKTIISIILNNGLDKIKPEFFYDYIDNLLKDIDSNIKDKLRNEINMSNIPYFTEDTINDLFLSTCYKRVLEEVKENIINIRNKALERKEEIDELTVIKEQLLNFTLDDNPH